MTKKPLCVAFLWHMHQPEYGNAETGDIYLPWTRFHGAKDYIDMAELVEEAPGFRATFNVVPSLMDQLEAYGNGTARETYSLLTLRDAAQLDGREKSFLLRSFFQVPEEHMLHPYPRYRQLKQLRGVPDEQGEYPEGLRKFSAQDYRDLQVWFNLTWCGRRLRKQPPVAALFRKGKGFSEEDKRQLIEAQRSFLGATLPYYRRLADERRIELSVSPYYHPILPLLCDVRSAREALPSIPLPSTPFAYPGDARDQIRRAQERYREVFGRESAGLWPSEGSISSAAVSICREAGLRWVASDEGVLLRSLQKEGLDAPHLDLPRKYSAYEWPGGGPALFFRDRALSDLIGFTYSRWQPVDAACDFVQRLRRIHAETPDDRHYMVPVILDGENAWEHYAENGSRFLSELYRLIVESRELRPVTFCEFLELEPHREPLQSILAGSWIYSNLATWVGHPEKNRAWDALAGARRFLESRRGADAGVLARACNEMRIAEGSDWFWWYGDDHQTHNAVEFDTLFRSHVKNVYRLLGEPYPPELDAPIKSITLKTQFLEPVHTIKPQVDGKVSDYFEWLPAGFAVPGGGESMHRTDRTLEKVYFGYDTRTFYLRIDLRPGLRGALPPGCSVRLRFVASGELHLSLEFAENRTWRCRVLHSSTAEPSPVFAASRILELGVPLPDLGIDKPGEVRFSLCVMDGERETERFPVTGFLNLHVDPWGIDHREWIV